MTIKLILLFGLLTLSFQCSRVTTITTTIPIKDWDKTFNIPFQTSVMDTSTCVLDGRVIDKNGTPMDSVQIKLYTKKKILKKYSNKNGNYNFKHFIGGKHTLQFSKKGYKKIFFKKIIFKSGCCTTLNIKFKN